MLLHNAYPVKPDSVIAVKSGSKTGMAAVDQIRTVDKRRLVKKVDSLPSKDGNELLKTLGELFTF